MAIQVVQRSKRYKEAAKKAVADPVAIDKAIDLLKGFNATKFDQSVELIFSLGIDPKQADQMIRGSLSLAAWRGQDRSASLPSARSIWRQRPPRRGPFARGPGTGAGHREGKFH